MVGVFLFVCLFETQCSLCCLFRGLLKSDLRMKRYSSRFHLLLHLEEIQMEVDIRKYDLRNQTMTLDPSNKNLLILSVSREDDHMIPEQVPSSSTVLLFGVYVLIVLCGCVSRSSVLLDSLNFPPGINKVILCTMAPIEVNYDGCLQVPGVAENRPSVLHGDCIKVTMSDDKNNPITVYRGYVHKVELDRVKLGFNKR